MQLLWASMVPKDLDLGTKAVGQVQKWSNAQSQSWWPPENRNGGWNQAVGQEEEQSGTALAQVWDAIPKDVQSLLEGVGCSPTPAPPPGLSQVGKTGNGKGKGKGKGGLKKNGKQPSCCGNRPRRTSRNCWKQQDLGSRWRPNRSLKSCAKNLRTAFPLSSKRP